jgi:hypothetical protein
MFRRLRSLLLGLATVASAMLLVLTPLACASSYRDPRVVHYDWLEQGGGEVAVGAWTLISANGTTTISRDRTAAITPQVAGWFRDSQRGFRPVAWGGPGRRPVRPWGRFGYRSTDPSPSDTLTQAWVRSVSVPYWFWFAAFAVLPAAWGYRLRQRRRAAARAVAGFCRVCGYDLRASAGRCPECGTGEPSEAESSISSGAGVSS